MKIQQFLNTLIVAALFGAFSVQAQASNCGELSPLMTTLGKQYTQLSYTPENVSGSAELDQDGLIDIIESSKLHSGQGVRVECLGDNGQWVEDRTTFTLTDIEQRENNKGSLMLSAFEETTENRDREVIELPMANKWQLTSKNHYSTSYLFRLHNFTSNTSRAAEIALTLHRNSNAVVITETLYINGLKVDWVTWELNN